MVKGKRRKANTDKFTPGIFDMVLVNWDQLDDFKKDPLNWKNHPIRQKQALASSIKANGYGQTLVYNVHLGKFIDGHGRYDVAVKEQHVNIPIALGKWTEEQHRHLLQSVDPIGAMFETDNAALQSLNEAVKRDREKLKGLKTDMEHRHRQALQQLQYDIETHSDRIEKGESPKTLLPKGKRAQVKKRKADREQEEEYDDADDDISLPEKGVLEEVINDDCHFSSSNPLGIPDLLQDYLCPSDVLGPKCEWQDVVTYDKSGKPEPHNFYCYSSLPVKEPCGGGILGFYTEDWRFAHVYHSGAEFVPRIKSFDPYALVEPDFSTYWEWPEVKRMWSVYQSRWCSRFWQELGYYTIPIIRRMKPKGKDDWMIDTTIKPEVVSIQCRKITEKDKESWKTFGRSINTAFDAWGFQVCLIYGGHTLTKYIHGLLPKGPEYVMLDPYITARRRAMRK